MIIKYKELINVSNLNQFIYCPRRYWYIKFYNTIGNNFYKKDGELKHKNKSKKGGWVHEVYLDSEELGLKGKIDILERNDKLIPIERKRAEDYFYSDKIQVTGYCMLLEDNIDRKINKGVIYLYGSDKREEIEINEELRNKVTQTINQMRNLDSNNPPKFVDNPNKCKKCSTLGYCMPKESKMLGES
ncbi:CRISPR-associated protein Cas4 [Methanonatronarchaeum sp. AMET-Sl]|uniref:CRISPR-associated protein Cas4 n=1 Tax=Methanonatronarchaeum sp. AMET-Sl TaxID=3037654 RepID=UPI00244E3C02|nr:CRISPR-associated protein Cas4 [Methanonatronarchaeum sp. AMET-Sl]WGI17879.1 CRISPR-associated protein Cas4 [Methanonatronarchaeum sp. AMET-Sl]